MNNSHVSTTHILLFRVEQPGQYPVQVQLKGQFLNGTVAEGDEVIAYGEPRPGKTMKVKYVDNLTTGIPVTTRWPLWAKIIAVPVFAAIFGIFGFIAYSFATSP
ncbi:MAG TPA: hypothetical protein VF712_16150 [Thermoleophilaceae bacterium]